MRPSFAPTLTGPGIAGKITAYRKQLSSRWRATVPTRLEQREAARFAQMSWEHYCSLPGIRAVADQLGVNDCKCDVIAHYRISKLYEAVMVDLREKFPPPKKPRGRRR